MIRDTVLAETPASRATMRSVADWRGRGPLLPGVAAEGYFDFISSSAMCVLQACLGWVSIPSNSSRVFPLVSGASITTNSRPAAASNP